jgi:hypothetical protein
MKKLAVLNSFAVWLTLLVALMLFSGPAQAYVYDHFSSVGMNGSLWSNVGPDSGLFYQPWDGFLHFGSTTINQKDSWKSSTPVSGAFFLAMQYSNFQANNTATPGSSSGVFLCLSAGTNSVVADEVNNTKGNWFQGFSTIGGYSTPISSTVDSGWLGIGYNGIPGLGGEATVWYDAGGGWQKLATYAPDFNDNLYFSIMGKTQTGTSLSFQVNQVQLTSTPLPPSVLLLGSGLLGLAGWRRFRKG